MLASKVLYNRLSTDLCLWEPSAPEYYTAKPAVASTFDVHKAASYGGLGSAVLHSPIPGMFIMCKSGVHYGAVLFCFVDSFGGQRLASLG